MVDNYPAIKTFEDYCKYFDKNDAGAREHLFEIYQWGVKEKLLYKINGQKRHQRMKKERHEYLEKHPEERKKPGRPRKNPLPAPPVFSTRTVPPPLVSSEEQQ